MDQAHVFTTPLFSPFLAPAWQVCLREGSKGGWSWRRRLLGAAGSQGGCDAGLLAWGGEQGMAAAAKRDPGSLCAGWAERPEQPGRKQTAVGRGRRLQFGHPGTESQVGGPLAPPVGGVPRPDSLAWSGSPGHEGCGWQRGEAVTHGPVCLLGPPSAEPGPHHWLCDLPLPCETSRVWAVRTWGLLWGGRQSGRRERVSTPPQCPPACIPTPWGTRVGPEPQA